MDVVVKTLAFVLVFGLLVVFHEFGHYIVARWMGVQVLSFSVGFGPVLLRWVRGPTEYAIRALPLGGFVRMLGDDAAGPMDGPEARDPAAFHNKPVWRRMLIIAAGPIFNFILPIVALFAASLYYDAEVLPATVGTPIAGGPAALSGLQPGDTIVAVDDEAVGSFDDLVRQIGRRADLKTTLRIERQGKPKVIEVTPRTVVHAGAAEVGVVERVGRIQMSPLQQVATVAVQPDSPLWRAGLRSGDRITNVSGQRVETWAQLAASLHAASAPVVVAWVPLGQLAAVSKEQAASALDRLHKGAERKATVAPGALPPGDADDARLRDRWGVLPGHRLVGPLLRDSAEVEAGLQSGDEVVAIDGAPVAGIESLFDQLKLPYETVLLHPQYKSWAPADRIQRLRSALLPRKLEVLRALDPQQLAATKNEQAQLQSGARKPQGRWQAWLAQAPALDDTAVVRWSTTYTPVVRVGSDERPSLRIELVSLVDRVRPTLIANPRPVAHAWLTTIEQFSRGSMLILATTAELFKGNAPIKEVGGIIRMAQMTSEATDHGLERLVQLLAALSINLGILNLLPIPLVDGGQLLFLAIEAVRRQPASLRVRQIAAYAGLTFLGLLFLVVMKNDLQSLFAR